MMFSECIVFRHRSIPEDLLGSQHSCLFGRIDGQLVLYEIVDLFVRHGYASLCCFFGPTNSWRLLSQDPLGTVLTAPRQRATNSTDEELYFIVCFSWLMVMLHSSVNAVFLAHRFWEIGPIDS